MATVTLLSDFGLTDPYVAEMKGVILSENPDVTIVDVSHGIERHNLAMGSFVLETALPFFPDGSIHVGVVDPGVGTERLPLVVQSELGILVGPDNGLLVRAARRLGFKAAYQIDVERFKERVSSTFHGRDIFARTAASLANGMKPSDAGDKVERLVELDILAVSISHGRVICTVLYVDSFGNVILNLVEEDIRRSNLQERGKVSIKAKQRSFSGPLVGTYSDIPRGRLGVLRGSQGFLEIAMKEGNAAVKLGIRPLDRIEISLR
jgi:S-adenosyl-L-methionine hydrolase (adenosine-forming)